MIIYLAVSCICVNVIELKKKEIFSLICYKTFVHFSPVQKCLGLK